MTCPSGIERTRRSTSCARSSFTARGRPPRSACRRRPARRSCPIVLGVSSTARSTAATSSRGISPRSRSVPDLRPARCPGRPSGRRAGRSCSSRPLSNRRLSASALRLVVRAHLVGPLLRAVRADRAHHHVAVEPSPRPRSASPRHRSPRSACAPGPLPGPAPAANTTASAPSAAVRDVVERLDVAQHRLGSHLVQVARVVGVADQPASAVAALGEQPQQPAFRPCRAHLRPRRPWPGSLRARRPAARARPRRAPRAGTATPRCASGTPAPRGTSRSSGTSPTTAIVAACSHSATSGPVNVAPTITPRSSSTTSRDVPRASSRP